MFYKRYVWKGQHTDRPNIRKGNDGIRDYEGVSTEIRDILKELPDPTDMNNEIMFHLDNCAPTFVEMMANSIIGDTINVKLPNHIADEKAVREWNKCVNVKGQTLKDIVKVWIIDNFIFNRTHWRIQKHATDIVGNKRKYVDLQRMDPKKIAIDEDIKNGWEVLVQSTEWGRTAKTPMKFMKAELTREVFKQHIIVIPNHIQYVVTDSYFMSPPMDSALPFISFKYWLLTFMQKHSNKSLSGYLLGYIGDPASNIYPRQKEMTQAIAGTVDVLRQMKNFGVAAFPGDTKIEQIKPPDAGGNYINLYNLMNSQIMLAMYGSMSMREGDSVYKSSENVNEGNSHFIKGVRTMIIEKLKDFYVTHVVPDREQEDIIITFPEIRYTDIDKVISAISEFSKLGIFVDANEKRRSASAVFPFLWEKSLTPEEQAKLHKEFIELNKPSVAGEGNVAKSGEANKDKNKNVSKK